MSVWKTTHTHTYTPNSEKWNSENSCQGDDADGCGGGEVLPKIHFTAR